MKEGEGGSSQDCTQGCHEGKMVLILHASLQAEEKLCPFSGMKFFTMLKLLVPCELDLYFKVAYDQERKHCLSGDLASRCCHQLFHHATLASHLGSHFPCLKVKHLNPQLVTYRCGWMFQGFEGA